MPDNSQSLDFEDFSGGMADLDSPNDRASGEIYENLDISNEKKPISRPGSRILDGTASLISTSSGGVRENGSTGSAINYENDRHLILRSKGALYAKNVPSWDETTAWTEPPPPTVGWENLPSYKALTASAVIPTASYKTQLLLVGKDSSSGSDNFIVPQKMYLDSTNTWQTVRAGLPTPNDPYTLSGYTRTLDSAIRLANAIKAALNTHTNTADIHSSAFTLITAADATSESTLLTLTRALVTGYNSHVADIMGDTTAGYHIVGLGGSVMGTMSHPSYVSVVNVYDCVPILNKLRFGVNCHINSGVYWKTQANFPQGATMAVDNTDDSFTGAGSASFAIGDECHFIASVMPNPLTALTTYYVGSVNTANGKIKVSSSLANAIAGTVINITTNGTTVKLYKHPTNLHRSITAYVDYPYIHDEGFALESVGPFSGALAFSDGTLAPHNLFTPLVDSKVGSLLDHFADIVRHNNSAAKGYMASRALLCGVTGLVIQEDWQAWIATMKAHYAFKVHREELTSGGILGYHSTDAENAGTAQLLDHTLYDYPFIPDVFDAATWEASLALLKDMADHALGTQGGITPVVTGHITYGIARHIAAGGSTAGLEYIYSFVDKRYAVVYRSRYKTYESQTLEDQSAPLFTRSYAFFEQRDVDVASTAKSLTKVMLRVNFPIGSWGRMLTPPLIDGNPALSSAAREYFVDVYRTQGNGTVFYLAMSLDPNTLNSYYYIQDISTDAGLLLTDRQLYTTGGIVANAPVPRSGSAVLVEDAVYLGGVVEDDAPAMLFPSFTTGSATITLSAHGLADGQAVTFWNQEYPAVAATPMPVGIVMGDVHFVKNATTNTFEVSTIPGGTSVTITTQPSGGAIVTMGVERYAVLPKRIRQTVLGSTFSSPEDFFVDVESDVVCMGRAQEYPIAVCKKGVYRIEGTFSEVGQGLMEAKMISDRVSGISALGGITVGDIFYFIAVDGFYRTDGFKVEPITHAHLKKSVQSITTQDLYTFSYQNSQVQCAYDRFNNRIHWSIIPEGGEYATEIWTLHLNHGENGRGSFTKYTNDTMFAPTAVGYFRGMLIRGDYQGFVFKHHEDYKTDPKINRDALGSLVTDTGPVYIHIPYKWRMLAEDFGDKGSRKIVSKALIQLNNTGAITVLPSSINDKADVDPTLMKEIRFEGDYEGTVKAKRTFPASPGVPFQGTRCHSKQLQLEPGTGVVFNSDDYGTATVSGSTVTMDSAALPVIEGGLAGMFIHFERDGFETGYLISSQDSVTQLTLFTPPTAQTASRWEIRGERKGEVFNLLSVSLYANQIKSQPLPPSEDDGGHT